MKLVSLLLCFLPVWMTAQNTSGQIFFTQTVQIKISLPDDAPEEMKKMVPPTQVNQQTLLFTENETLYRDVNEEDNNNLDISHQDEDGNQVQIKIQRPKDVFYQNLDKGTVVEGREFMGRNFLVQDNAETLRWKISAEKKQILGYSCQKAVLQDTSKTVTAWFTTDIPVSAGPAVYGQLPGMILELDMDNGARLYTADKVILKPIEDKAIVAPDKGKPCTRAEYKKIVDDKMKEMGIEQGSGGGGVKIMVRH